MAINGLIKRREGATMLKSKITRRWLRNSFGVIVAIILIIEIVGGIAVKRYYYN